ncbi:MAG: TonB-dependent receptor domain-containing protein [Chthoniobacterales bacterium]
MDLGSLGGPGLAGRYRLLAANRYQNIAPRRFADDTNFYRFLIGVRSQFAKDWTAEAAVYYSHYQIDFANSGLVILNNLNDAINASNPDGSPIPGTTLDFFARNPIGTGPGQVSAATAATFFGTNIRKQDSYQEVFDGRITGLPFMLPGGPFGIALGAEYREEGFKAQDSPEIFLGSVPISPINKGRSIESAFAEVSVPIVGSSMHVPGVYNLEINLAGRYDHYEGVKKDAKVPKISLRYQPIKDLTLRATYANSFVAPNLYQLVGPTGQGFSPTITLKDPATGIAVVQDQAQGLTPANAALAPSTAESYTAGMVYSPSFVPGLTITADYFRTLQQGIVGINGAATILNSVNDLGTASQFINQVAIGDFPGRPNARRITAPGQLFDNLNSTFYVDPLVNAGAARVEGFDLSAHYNLDLQRFGQLELGVNSVVFTKQDLKRLSTTHYYNIGGLDQAEFGGATPDYKLTFLAEYRFAGFILSANANYIPALLNATGSDPENDDQSTYAPIDDYITVDGRLSYTFTGKTTPGAAVNDAKDAKTMMDGKSGGGVAGAPTMSPVQRLLDGTTITVGCNNIFDQTPPFVGRQNSATDLSVYDPYGQFVYFELSKKF